MVNDDDIEQTIDIHTGNLYTARIVFATIGGGEIKLSPSPVS